MYIANTLMKSAYEQHKAETNSEANFLEEFKAALIENRDNKEIIKAYDKKNTFFLLSDGSYYCFKKEKVHIKKANYGAIKSTSFEVHPSVEQQQIIYAALAGYNLKVQAFAGTGKTTTIKQLAAVIDKSSLYVAFNSAIVNEVNSQLPSHVRASTAHKLAISSVIYTSPQMYKKFEGWKELWYHNNVREYTGVTLNKVLLSMVIRTTKRFLKSVDKVVEHYHLSIKDKQTIARLTESSANKVINYLSELCQKHRKSTAEEISKSVFFLYQKPKLKVLEERSKVQCLVSNYLTKQECLELVQKTIKTAAQYSSCEVITEEDFPAKLFNKIADSEQANGEIRDSQQILTNKLLKAANHLWENIIGPESNCAIDHDSYLKLWQLSQPQINAEVIYIDEAQDLDPVMLDVLKKQKAQLIWLGDSYQQIYAWRGAVNALEQVDNCLEYELTETYRFPPSLTKYANAVLNVLGESRKIKSNKEQGRTLLGKTAIISRTNATLFDYAFNLAKENRYFAWSDNNFKPDQLLKHCNEIIKIHHLETPFMDIYKEFSSIEDIETFLEEESNDLLARPLALCKRFNFNISQIKTALNLISSHTDYDANLVLTTAHKSKGQEWDEVILTDDFVDAIERERRSDNDTMHEWNLLYVALTRAKKELSLIDGLKLILGISNN
jgi:UvrD/REP helicase N-terminal domain/UvrD-like helicase C-terminal domain